jgi:hypothetical protein
MSRRRIFASALAALAVVTLTVGCGSSDAPEAEGPFGETTLKAGQTSTTVKKPGGATSTTVTIDIKLTGDFCAKAGQLQTVGDDLFSGNTTDTSPAALLAGVEELFRNIDEIVGQLNQDPPAEIADDIAVLAKAASSSYKEIQRAKTFQEASELAKTGLGGTDQPEELEKATANIEAYAEKECGITGE